MLSLLLHAWRSWKNAKSLFLLAVAALAVGIGSTTAIYTVVQAVLLNPLPYADPDRHVAVTATYLDRPGSVTLISYLDLQDYAAGARTLDNFGCTSIGTVNARFEGDPMQVTSVEVSPGLGRATGVTPLLGQWFDDKDSGGYQVAVISSLLWKQWGSRADIVGKPLMVNGAPYTIRGVMPSWFRLPVDNQNNQVVWIPLHPTPDQLNVRDYRYLSCTAKMKAGVSLPQVTGELKSIAAVLDGESPSQFGHRTVAIAPLLSKITARVRPTLILLLGAAGALLLIACANVASLLLARSVARRQETGVRVALGATAWQLGLQYFSEGLLVSLAGAAAGSLLSYALVQAALAIGVERIPRLGDITVDAKVLAFAVGLSILCGILFSLAPLWQARQVPAHDVLREGARASGSALSRRMLRAFVVTEIALAFALVAIGGIVLTQLRDLYRVPLGFDPDNLLFMDVVASGDTMTDREALIRYETRLIDAVGGVPGVERSGFANLLPFLGSGDDTGFEVEGKPKDYSFAPEKRFISPEYFAAMRIPLIAGRYLDDGDKRVEKGPMAMVIDQTTARTFWPAESPLGSLVRISAWGEPRFQIVGVVGDVRNEGVVRRPRGEVYMTYRELAPPEMMFVVRSPRDTESLSHDLRHAVQSINPEQAIARLFTMRSMWDISISNERLQSFMVAFFAASALLLAILGLYGVISYAVRQRTTEIGTRMALGATTGDLMRLVIGDGLKMAGVGVVIGLAGMLALMRVLGAGTSALKLSPDIPSFLISLGLVTGFTMLACFVPAWRATLVSPMIAIRDDAGGMRRQTRIRKYVADRVSDLISRDEPSAAENALLAGIADASRQAESFDAAIQAALGTLRSQIGASSAVLLVQRGVGQPYRDADYSLPTDALIVGRLRQYSSALEVTPQDLDTWSRWAKEYAPHRSVEIQTLEQLNASLAAPVMVKTDVVGVLFLGRPVEGEKYDGLARRLLRGAAAQIALIVENGRLTDRIVEQERTRREILLATEVQKRLFPEKPPEMSSLQLAGISVPARSVGGDYSDFLDLGNRQIGIALADVAGKGIAAALLMSVVQASLRSLAGSNGASLADLASKMNRLLHRSTGSSSYATFFYAQYDEDTRQLRYVNAGHNPPYLMRAFVASEPIIEELGAGGTIIGMFAQSAYEESVVDLKPGDIRIAFTDGVPEAQNPDEEEFGEDRLKVLLRANAHLPVNDLAAKILGELKTWISDAAQYDDLTFIVMKVQ